MKILLTSIILIVLLFNLFSFGEDEREEPRSEDKYDYLKLLTKVEDFTQPIKRELRKNKIDLNFFGGILQGYDNNVDLGPDRKKDAFNEMSMNTEFIYNYTDDVRLKMENDTTDIIYYNANKANLLDIYNKAGMEMDVFNDLFTLGANYVFDYVLFPNDPNGTYLGNQFKVFLQYNASPNMYHKLGYRFLHKGYTHDTTVSSFKVKTGNLRRDARSAIDYEFKFYFSDMFVFKTNMELYRNDSNYQYYDYYDYWSFLIRPSGVLMVTDKFYLTGSFTYQQRRYDDRLSSEDDSTVKEDTWIFNGSVLYDITKSFTLAFNISYRDNRSNEPLQKYAGTIMTAGLYYSF